MAEKDTKDTSKGNRRTVTVNVALHGQTGGQTLPSTRAYLFDRAGRLVDSKPVAQDKVQFEVAANKDYRVTVGPELLAKSEKPPVNLAARLAKTKAISQDILQASPQDKIAIAVNPNLWICWIPTCINVHGTVNKLQTGGTTHNLFEIPDPSLPWVDINDPADRPFAYFDSTEGTTPRKSGPCTLLLEMFDSNGNFVPCNNTLGSSTLDDQGTDAAPPGPFTYILPEIGGPPDNYTNAPQPNITDHGRLIFRILVDNNETVAELPSVATPYGSTDTDPCGVLYYSSLSDNVELDYVAFPPNNFLDWDLTISRGISGVVASIPPSPPATTDRPPSHLHSRNSHGRALLSAHAGNSRGVAVNPPAARREWPVEPLRPPPKTVYHGILEQPDRLLLLREPVGGRSFHPSRHGGVGGAAAIVAGAVGGCNSAGAIQHARRRAGRLFRRRGEKRCALAER